MEAPPRPAPERSGTLPENVLVLLEYLLELFLVHNGPGQIDRDGGPQGVVRLERYKARNPHFASRKKDTPCLRSLSIIRKRTRFSVIKLDRRE